MRELLESAALVSVIGRGALGSVSRHGSSILKVINFPAFPTAVPVVNSSYSEYSLDEAVEAASHEVAAYDFLKPMHGSLIPRLYQVMESCQGGRSQRCPPPLMLVMSDAGARYAGPP